MGNHNTTQKEGEVTRRNHNTTQKEGEVTLGSSKKNRSQKSYQKYNKFIKSDQKDRERSRSPKPKRQTKDPIRAILPISLSDAYEGRTKSLSVQYKKECTMC